MIFLYCHHRSAVSVAFLPFKYLAYRTNARGPWHGPKLLTVGREVNMPKDWFDSFDSVDTGGERGEEPKKTMSAWKGTIMSTQAKGFCCSLMQLCWLSAGVCRRDMGFLEKTFLPKELRSLFVKCMMDYMQIGSVTREVLMQMTHQW